MEWQVFLAKLGRIHKNALYRINGSAPRHGDIFFYAFGKKESSSRTFLIWRFCKGEEEEF